MKRSEKILLTLFAVLFLLIIGGGGLAMGVSHYLAILEENEGLRDRVTEMNEAISQGSEWQRKFDWLDKNVPGFSSRQEASSRLLETIQKEAEKLTLTFADRQFLEASRQVGQDGLPLEERGGYYDQASVRVTLSKAKEQAFFSWVHALQSSGQLIGITRLQITPAGEGKTINVEAEVTQFYLEKAPAKLSKADTP